MSRPRTGKGPRYTPPKPRPNVPPPAALSLDELQHREDEQFWKDHRMSERALRSRCAALLPHDPPTDVEWQDAMLIDMSGQEASDEELVAYWELHRTAIDLGSDDLPDLRFVTDALQAGENPSDKYRQWWNELDEDDDEMTSEA